MISFLFGAQPLSEQMMINHFKKTTRRDIECQFPQNIGVFIQEFYFEAIVGSVAKFLPASIRITN